MNNSPSNIFLISLFIEKYHQNYQAVLAATGMTELTHQCSQQPKPASQFDESFQAKALLGKYLKEKC